MAFTNYGSGNIANYPTDPVKAYIYQDSLANTAYQQEHNPTYQSGGTTVGIDPTTGDWGVFPTSPSGTTQSAPAAAPTGNPEQDAINAQIDEYYNSSMGRLNSQEGALRGNEQNYYNIATNPYTSQMPLVQQAGQEGQNAISNQRNATGVQEQNALAAARRLYDELTSRNRQAFGSGALGSVGQASSEILGRTAQQGMGSIRSTADETMQKLYTAANDLKAKTDAQLQSLELQKQQALSQAKLAFQERLDMINQQKELVGQAKAQAKLDELKDYRDYIRSIADQSQALSQQITSQANQQLATVKEAVSQYGTGVNSAVQGGATNVYNQGVSNTGSYNTMGESNNLSSSNETGSGLLQYGYNPYATAQPRKKTLLDQYTPQFAN